MVEAQWFNRGGNGYDHYGTRWRCRRRSGTQKLTWILALWLGIPEDNEINTAMRDKREQLEKNSTFCEKIKDSRCVLNTEGLKQSTTHFTVNKSYCSRLKPELTCYHCVDTFIQQRHGRGTVREGEKQRYTLYICQIKRTWLSVECSSSNLWIKLVRGSISFFPSRGSSGVSAPNCEHAQRGDGRLCVTSELVLMLNWNSNIDDSRSYIVKMFIKYTFKALIEIFKLSIHCLSWEM